jgi:hypothetical protein
LICKDLLMANRRGIEGATVVALHKRSSHASS